MIQGLGVGEETVCFVAGQRGIAKEANFVARAAKVVGKGGRVFGQLVGIKGLNCLPDALVVADSLAT